MNILYGMTGFSRYHIQKEWGGFCWEIRSLNHRYLDVLFRMPDYMREHEASLRQITQTFITRGKLDAVLSISFKEAVSMDIIINEPLMSAIAKTQDKLSQQLDLSTSASVMDVLRWPGLVEFKTNCTKTIIEDICEGYKNSLQMLNKERLYEGQEIRKFLSERVLSIRTIVGRIESLQRQSAAKKNEKFKKTIIELSHKVDSNRLEQEVLMLLQKIDIDEEVHRLYGHLNDFEKKLSEGGVLGRYFDFLLQEVNRETNTIASKASDMEISHAVVDMKVLVEQMREQVQNLE